MFRWRATRASSAFELSIVPESETGNVPSCYSRVRNETQIDPCVLGCAGHPALFGFVPQDDAALHAWLMPRPTTR